MTVQADTSHHLELVDPETGEYTRLDDLADAELDDMHLHLVRMVTEYRLLEQRAYAEIRRRAEERGGLDGHTRRWAVRWTRGKTTEAQQKGSE